LSSDLRTLFGEVLLRINVSEAIGSTDVIQALRDQTDCSLLIIGFGKAARAMASALIQALPEASMRGLVVTPRPDDAPLAPFEVIAAGHPLPDSNSIRAAQRALDLARSASPNEQIIFLVSGGGSALLELPADHNVTQAELESLNQALIGSGADIDQINIVRRHLSAIKGGRLAMAAAAAAKQITLAISDVPTASPPASLASGPTMPDDTTLADCKAVLDQYGLWPAVPASLRTRIERNDLLPAMPQNHPLVARSEFVRVLDERDAQEAAVDCLRQAGYIVAVAQSVDNWNYEDAANNLLKQLESLHHQHRGQRIAIVTTGELSVTLPNKPGSGGRNQQFALYCATRIQGKPITVLSCGTDGIDGNSPAAGAVVDGTTLDRADASGHDAATCLTQCDAHSLLREVGDAIRTGATGMNLRDLRILTREN
jgi:glycerate 2-kinase